MRVRVLSQDLPRSEVFFALTACSWMPHWACHFFRLGTGSTFVVGSWTFSRLDSEISLIIYGALALLNLLAVTRADLRIAAALVSASGHSCIGLLHLIRLFHPFRFEILGHPWPLGASAVQSVVLLLLAILCFLAAAIRLRTKELG